MLPRHRRTAISGGALLQAFADPERATAKPAFDAMMQMKKLDIGNHRGVAAGVDALRRRTLR